MIYDDVFKGLMIFSVGFIIGYLILGPFVISL